MKRKLLLSLGFSMLLAAAPASAAVLDFEWLYPGYETAGNLSGAGYNGFTINSGWLTKNFQPASGYYNGILGTAGLFNFGEDDMVLQSGAAFDFNGAYLTAAWNNNETMAVEGWLGGSLLYTSNIVTSYTGPYWFNFNYTGIDKVVFRSAPSDGSNAGLGGSGSHIVLDNFTYNAGSGTVPTPEPSTFLLLGGALAGAGLWSRKRKRA